MGIDYEGGMIVGEWASVIVIEDAEDYEIIEEWGMQTMSPYYDCGIDQCCIGFSIEDVLVKDIDEWVKKVKELAIKFETLTGTPAKLIGTQNIT